jgi:hypothetical protein
MFKFSQYLSEATSTAGKNLHLEHLEDEILNNGLAGGKAALNFLESLTEMLSSDVSSKVNVTVKWDGAPAVFFGIDPEDGKFFVAKKGIFNKNPKIYKSHADIEADTSGDLTEKLKIAFDNLQKLDVKTVYQGDMMFTKSDLKSETIDGESLITFQPNTIVYAVPSESDLAKQMKSAQMGIVIHTEYKGGPTLQDTSASFNIDISGLRKTKDVWFQDAEYKDTSGTSTFTAKETRDLNREIMQASKLLKNIKPNEYKAFMKMQESLKGGQSGAGLKTYINSLVRKREGISNTRRATLGYAKYFEEWWTAKQIDTVKTEKSKANKTEIMQEHLKTIRKSKDVLLNIMEFMNALVEIKIQIIRKLEKVQQMTKTFIRTDSGFNVTEPEGFVAVDKIDGKAVKLVDRMEFSFNNFTAAKNWSK